MEITFRRPYYEVCHVFFIPFLIGFSKEAILHLPRFETRKAAIIKSVANKRHPMELTIEEIPTSRFLC